MRNAILVMLLCVFFLGLPGLIFAQNESELSLYQMSLMDIRELDRAVQERDLLKPLVESQAKTIDELKNSLSIEQKTNELNAREIDIQRRMLEVKDKEIEASKAAFDQMKIVADQALKLAETASKSKPNLLTGLIGIVLGAFGMALIL